MRILFAFILLQFYTSICIAQSSSDIVSWKYTVSKTTNNENKVELIFNAKIKEGWHLYSQHINGDGPIPTTFIFNTNENFSLLEDVKEGVAVKTFDPNFDMEISFFENETTFKQVVEVKNNELKNISGTIEFMVCNDKMCYPPDIITFSFDLN